MQIADIIRYPDREAAMWIAAIGITTIITFILAYFCISAGIYNVFPHLFYITIVVASYFFPIAGIIYTILISLGYLGIQSNLLPDMYGSMAGIDAVMRTFTFIAVSVVVSLTSSVIRRREATQKAILSGSPSGIVLTKKDGIIIEYNKVFADYFRKGVKDLTGCCILSLTREPDKLRDILTSITKQRTAPAILPFVSENNTTLWLYVTGSLTTDGSLIIGLSDLSQQKIAQEQREKDRIILSSLIDNIPEPVWMRDTNGELLVANRRFFEIDSKNRTAEGSLTCAELFLFTNDDMQVIVTGEQHQAVETVVTADSQIRYITITKSPVFDDSETVIGITGIAIDSTSQIQMQNEIRQREEELENVVNANPMGILVIDTDRHVLLVNQALEILLGMEKKEILQTGNIRKLFGNTEDPPLLLEIMLEDEVDLALEKYFSGNYYPSPTVPGAFEVIEFFPQMDQGRGMYLRFTAARITTREGETYGAIATIENYTELQTIRHTLEINEERFKAAARMATDFIFEVEHATGMVSWFSDRDMVILSGSFTTSQPCRINQIVERIDPDDRDRVADALSSHLKSKEALNLEFRIRENSGQYRIWFVQAEVMPGRSRTDRRTIGVITDITAKRMHEESERNAYAAIEENIAQFAILGDHIRNPLQAISGYNDMGAGEYGDKIQEHIQEINRIVDQLDRGWIRSDSIREFLRRNYGLLEKKQTLYPEIDE